MPRSQAAEQPAPARPPGALPAHVPPSVRTALADAAGRLREAYGERLRRVVLYGSHARGEATPESDVDVLVVLDGFEENRYRELKRTGTAWGDLLERYGLSLSFHLYTEKEYQTQGGPFMHNVHEEGIELPQRLT